MVHQGGRVLKLLGYTEIAHDSMKGTGSCGFPEYSETLKYLLLLHVYLQASRTTKPLNQTQLNCLFGDSFLWA